MDGPYYEKHLVSTYIYVYVVVFSMRLLKLIIMKDIYINIAVIIHACCTYLIISSIRMKPMGMQTLLDVGMYDFSIAY